MKLNGTHTPDAQPVEEILDTCRLVLACTAEWIDETDVKILDCSEHVTGANLLRFRCPRCLGEHESFRYF